MFDRITINPEQLGGVPCIRGQRIPVSTLLRGTWDMMRYMLRCRGGAPRRLREQHRSCA
ncbi:MAG: DUF433 domain-containing protein [Aggregatilineales bacterium]